MTSDANTPATPLPSLAGAAWLAQSSTQAVLGALRAAGYEGRIVGGSVRNTLMSLPVSDLDIATPATPDAVTRACKAAGLSTVPTGLDHGTVTVISDHKPIEVTTLRRDIATDGRRATIAFTESWAEDAERRDFTMNALYCDGDGRLYDFVGGYADLIARRVRFIGDADQRIAEDYLRILRFFRFHASYAAGEPDRAAMAACARGVQGIARLSAERIRAELVKLLVAPGSVAAVRAMEDIGLLPALLGVAPRPDVMASLVDAERDADEEADAMLRLSALAIATDDDIERIADRLRLSNEERTALLVIDREAIVAIGHVDERRARAIVYRKGRDTARRLALALRAIAPERAGEATRLRDTARSWQPPRLPVAGRDLVARGLEPGPSIGALLSDLERWWIEADFPSPDRTRAQLDILIAAHRDA
ncbi:MAG: CCA tRNA nucleotidyltransferase [Hyphomicrobiaceae bacterium]